MLETVFGPKSTWSRLHFTLENIQTEHYNDSGCDLALTQEVTNSLTRPSGDIIIPLDPGYKGMGTSLPAILHIPPQPRCTVVTLQTTEVLAEGSFAT